MYKKILVPLDSSEFSECSLSGVKEVTGGNPSAEVILLGVVEPIPADVAAYLKPHFIMEVEQSSEKTFRDYLDKIAAILTEAGLTVKTAVVHGKAAEEILHYISGNGIDLVIMSTHGRSGIAKWTLGSVADRILRNAGVPVLLNSPKSCRI